MATFEQALQAMREGRKWVTVMKYIGLIQMTNLKR